METVIAILLIWGCLGALAFFFECSRLWCIITIVMFLATVPAASLIYVVSFVQALVRG